MNQCVSNTVTIAESLMKKSLRDENKNKENLGSSLDLRSLDF